MRLLIVGGFTLWVAAVAAQAPQTPADHPAAPNTGRRDASTLTEQLRPSTAGRPVAAVPRKNFDDTPSGRAFHYIEPFAARQMIRSQEITPLFV